MPDSITTLTQGLPVEIGKIDRELKRLWQADENVATRASLMNFAIYCEGEDAMRDSTGIIAQITQDHACRAILIGREPSEPGAGVEACISAHCHLSRAGAKQVCCEQISFHLGSEGLPLIPNIVFSHLDTDLPLVLWWRGELPEKSEDTLWSSVHRLIFDSQSWSHPGAQFDLIRSTIEPASPRMTLCDLNWTRSLYIRQAIAQIFDHPEYLDELAGIDTAEIVHAPGMRSTALLMAGWLGAQLRWKLGPTEPSRITFTNAHGRKVSLTFRESPGRAIGGVQLCAGESCYCVKHQGGSDFLYADIHGAADREAHYLMPGGKDDIVCLLNDELMSGGKHKVYLKAVRLISEIL